jgi:hypothetical protein
MMAIYWWVIYFHHKAQDVRVHTGGGNTGMTEHDDQGG